MIWPTVMFPCQHNGLQVLFALDVHSVGVSEYGHYTAPAQGSLLDWSNKDGIFHFGNVEVW